MRRLATIFIVVFAALIVALLLAAIIREPRRERISNNACHSRGMKRAVAQYVTFCVAPNGQVFFFIDAQTNYVTFQ